MGAKTATGTSARERLLDAANELFYAEGVHTVGIDRVIERAGVAKASLYNTFGSKDELVRAYLQDRHARTASRISRWVERSGDPRARLLAVFDAQGELFADPEFRGCAFASASAESPGEAVSSATNSPARRAPPNRTSSPASCTWSTPGRACRCGCTTTGPRPRPPGPPPRPSSTPRSRPGSVRLVSVRRPAPGSLPAGGPQRSGRC